MLEEQRRLEDRIKQEKEDRALARRLEREERGVDRRKGGQDGYMLRGGEARSVSCSL